MRIDLSLSNGSGEFNIAAISDKSPKERTDNQTPEIAVADDRGRRNAVPSAGKDNNSKGHTRYDKTYARMHKTFIWPGMSKNIKKYVDACISCAQRKTSLHAKPAPLKRDMDYPFDEIFKPLQVRYDADSNYIAEFMQRMEIAHRNAIKTIGAMTDRVHGQFNTKAKEPGFAIGDRVYLYQRAIQAGFTSKLAKNG
ncbi:hypothetical protein JTB14_006277 [Gonioctena quinquepunctata]|nr:hypothetical protein JTB14_006277 [Gonioctena quinquepunctata]